MAARAALMAAARRVPSLSSPASHAQAAKLIPRRGLAGGGDHHGPPKINCWQDPLSPSKWKEEHFVIVSLTGWGLLFFGGYKFFSGGKKEKKEETAFHLPGIALLLLQRICQGLYLLVCLHGGFLHALQRGELGLLLLEGQFELDPLVLE
ncbi:hypothetical protein Taro_036468, partial [Colocasia esculenta]|nr:hypothetical protein [Colocasia esculenta]